MISSNCGTIIVSWKIRRIEKRKKSDLADQITGGKKKRREWEIENGEEGEAYNIPNKRIPRCDTWIKYRPRYNISIMMIEGQRTRGVAREEGWHGEMRQKGEWRTREERPRVEDWTVPVRECWAYWAAYGPHRPLCPSIPPFPDLPRCPSAPFHRLYVDNPW